MEIVSDPSQNAINSNRRLVICQVFQDLAEFIVSDNLNYYGNKVNIWVRDINNVVISPNFTNGILGYGTSYYNVPYNNSASFGGIADGEVWKTIHTGRDSYNGLSSPLISNGSTTPSYFYHGVIAINFNTNNSPEINWYSTPLTSNATNLNHDLYTEILRQATHLLGFTSLIDVNGQSKFGSGYNYYSRYDLFLKNNANTQSLIKNNVNECSLLYNYNFNTNLSTSILNPNPSSCFNTTDCLNAIKYGVNSVPVFTPNCFDRYSLSHFEDICTIPPNANDAYFVMCNAPSNSGTGINPINTKRFLKPEERNVLIDLGYSVKNVYGNSSQKSYFFYGGINPTIPHPSGINSGIQTNGEYYFYGTTNININVGLIINNQLGGVTGFECLQDIYDPTATINGVNNLTILNVSSPYPTLNFQSNVLGLHLLRFVPVKGQGNLIVRGNITYVYVFVNSVPANSCNIINNGSFEASLGCGVNIFDNFFWSTLAYTPDSFNRNCTNNNNSFNVGTSTAGSNPASNSFNGTPNDSFVGLYSNTGGTEAIQTNLSNPLIAGNQYVLSFWAKINNGFTTIPNLAVSFSSYPNQLAYSSNLISGSFQNFAPNSIQVGQPINIPNDNAWHYYTIPFTLPSGTPNHNMLAVYLANENGYMFLDDIFILPQTQFDTFNLPNSICVDSSIPNLATYFNPNTPTNGNLTFSGNGVTLNSGIYSFNPSTANIGLNTISYSYSYQDCVRTFYDTINVISGTTTISTFNPIPAFCQGSTPPILPTTSTNGITGTWNPSTVSNTTTGNYTFTPTAGQCATNVSVTTTFTPATITPTFNPIAVLCQGSTPPVLPTTSTNGITGTWSPATVSPTTSGNYTFTPNAGQCATTFSRAIQVLSNTAFVSNTDAFTVTLGSYVTTSVTTPSVLINDTYNGGAIPATIAGIPYSIALTGTAPTIPAGGITFNAATGIFTVLPNTTEGTYVYQYYLQNNCYSTPIKTVKIVVNRLSYENIIGLSFCYGTTAANSGTTLYSGTKVNGVQMNTTNATISLVAPTTTLPTGITSISPNGSVNLAAGVLPGQITFYYKITSNSTGSSTVTKTCIITIERTFFGNQDNITTTAGTNGTVIYNVLSNDQYRGGCGNTNLVPATTSNVTITNVVNDLPYYKIIPATGAIQPGTTPSTLPTVGTHLMSYTICDNANLNICQTVSVIINVPALKMSGVNNIVNNFDIDKTIISPNPASSNVTILFNDVIKEDFNIEFYDVVGRLLIQKQIPKDALQYDLDLSNYASANYFIKIYNNEPVGCNYLE